MPPGWSASVTSSRPKTSAVAWLLDSAAMPDFSTVARCTVLLRARGRTEVAVQRGVVAAAERAGADPVAGGLRGRQVAIVVAVDRLHGALGRCERAVDGGRIGELGVRKRPARRGRARSAARWSVRRDELRSVGRRSDGPTADGRAGSNRRTHVVPHDDRRCPAGQWRPRRSPPGRPTRSGVPPDRALLLALLHRLGIGRGRGLGRRLGRSVVSVVLRRARLAVRVGVTGRHGAAPRTASTSASALAATASSSSMCWASSRQRVEDEGQGRA